MKQAVDELLQAGRNGLPLKELAGLVAHAKDFCQRVRTSLATATFEQERQLVELLIDRVIVTDEDVEIRYVIPTSSRNEQVRFCHLRSDYFPPPFGSEAFFCDLQLQRQASDHSFQFGNAGLLRVVLRVELKQFRRVFYKVSLPSTQDFRLELVLATGFGIGLGSAEHF
jgi:hypothetical protein